MASGDLNNSVKVSNEARMPLSGKIKTLINNILSSSDLIKTVILTTLDGFTIAYASNNDNANTDPKWLGALVISSLKSLENNLKRALGSVNISDILLTTNDDLILVKELGKLVIVVIADKNIDIYALIYGVIDNSLDLIKELELKV